MAIDPKQVQAAFLEVVAAETAERAGVLDRVCAVDAELRRRVELLLRAHDDSGDLPAAGGTAEQTLAHHTGEQPGAVIAGRYKLLEAIGEGGMGTVWVAEQIEPVRRKVALKLVKAGMDSKSVLARFEAERQALAVMDHPNIAKVHDGGLTESGRPYFVMEYVKGVPITEYCDATRLSVPQRLELFAQVCQAVQHAHQKGIIHRDLKPSNILVAPYDDKAVPKVIDFGLAKAMHQSLTERTLHTAHETVLGTPLYMSPEQAQLNNIDVDTRSDIYSLGVLLYELLTGTTPMEKQRFKEAAWDEVKRIIREEEAPRPSTRLSSSNTLASLAAGRQMEPAKLTKLVRGELDWIVMKALEKDRTRRYETASSFAADVQRYLAGEPVLAAPPSASYRLKKFVRRNRPQVIAASLVLLALMAGMAGTTFGLIRAETARDAEAAQRAKAEKARDRTRDVLDAMTSSVTGDSLSTQKEISADQKKFLVEVLTYYREFADEKADDEQSRARTANAAYRVGLIEYRLGRKEQGIAAFQLARDAFRSLAADFPAEPVFRQNVASSHNNLGILLAELGKQPEAEEQHRQALAMEESLAAEFPNLPLYRESIARSHNNLGFRLRELGKSGDAEVHYGKAISIQERLVGEFPNDPEYRQILAQLHDGLGVLRGELSNRGDEEPQYRKALAIREKLTADFPAMAEYRADMAYSHNNLGSTLAYLGKSSEAEEHFRKALAIREKLVTDFPAVPKYLQNLAVTQNNLGGVQENLEKQPEALEQYRKALAIREKLAADFPSVPAYRQELAFSHNNLGLLLAGLGNPAEAEEHYRKALAIREKLAVDFPAVPAYRLELARSHNSLGALLYGLGKPAEAEEQYRQALAILEKLAADFPIVATYGQDLARSHNNLGVLLYGLGRRAEAEEQYRQALAIFAKLAADFPTVPDYRQGLAGSHNNQGNLLVDLGKRSAAEEQYRQALAIQEKLAADFASVTAYRQDLARGHNNLGIRLADLGQRAEADEEFRKALAVREKLAADFAIVPDYQIELGGSYCNYGILVRSGGRTRESLDWFEKAIATLGPVHRAEPRDVTAKQYLRNSHAERAKTYDALTKPAEATKDWEQVIELSSPNEEAWARFQLGCVMFRLGNTAEAEVAFDRGLDLREQAAKDAGPNAKEPNWLVAVYLMDRGLVYLNANRPEQAVESFARASRELTSFEKRWPGPDVTHQLRWAYQNRAIALGSLKKDSQAIKDWDRVIELCPPADQPGVRAGRANSQLRAGLVAEAVAEVAELTKSPNWNAGQWYNFACVYAVASGKIADRKQEYADRAMELLREAVQAGFNNVAQLKQDTDLDPLREREDFKKLLAELELK